MSGTRLDMVLGDYKKVFKANDEDVKALMEKYWYKRKVTMNDIVNEYQKLQDEPLAEDLLIQHLTSKLINHFDRMPVIIRKSLLYAIFKHYEKESIEEMKLDIEDIPQYLKDFIDERLFSSVIA